MSFITKMSINRRSLLQCSILERKTFSYLLHKIKKTFVCIPKYLANLKSEEIQICYPWLLKSMNWNTIILNNIKKMTDSTTILWIVELFLIKISPQDWTSQDNIGNQRILLIFHNNWITCNQYELAYKINFRFPFLRIVGG